jgi:hypothetical protein
VLYAVAGVTQLSEGGADLPPTASQIAVNQLFQQRLAEARASYQQLTSRRE